MHTIVLALGTNMGEKENNISEAIHLLEEKVHDIRRAKLYHSRAVGYENQPDFINTAISGTPNLSPNELLEFTQQIEKNIGRIFRFHWGPREIDVDIIFYDDLALSSEKLTIPHPKMHERDFVLSPINDICPDFLHPILKNTVSELFDKLDSSQLSIVSLYDNSKD